MSAYPSGFLYLPVQLLERLPPQLQSYDAEYVLVVQAVGLMRAEGGERTRRSTQSKYADVRNIDRRNTLAHLPHCLLRAAGPRPPTMHVN